MSRHQLMRAVDAIATRNPERLGFGYADTQNPWHCDPAIEQARTGFHLWLEFVETTAPRATIVQIGRGRRGGSHLALQQVGRRVVNVDRDAGCLEALRGVEGFDAERSLLICGDSASDEVFAAVAAAATGCDVLLLDGGDSYEQARCDWERYAPLVRDGGLVSIVDRSQVWPTGRAFDVDRFAIDLERDFLQPRGVRWVRHGNAHAIHSYVQTAATRTEVRVPDWPPGFVGARAPEPQRDVAGFSLIAWRGQYLAVPASTAPLGERALHDPAGLVLCAADAAGAARLVTGWVIAEPRLAAARRLLRAGRVEEAAHASSSVRREMPWLREALVPCVERAPWSRELLLALGTLGLFGDAPLSGALLLRRALDLAMIDSEGIQTVAAAWLQVLRDEDGARALLADVKQHVHRTKVAQVCHLQLRGHLLWDYPQLLAAVHGVIEVGAHRGEHLAAWTSLGIAEQCHVEAHPLAFAELERACRQMGSERALALHGAVGAQISVGTLRHGGNTAHASFLRTHALAELPPAEQQTHELSMPVTTLDELVAADRIDARRYDLLLVDTEGTELEVLRGAVALLQHVEIVCVGVFLQPVYEGAPMPQEIQTFLRELPGVGFGLCAFEPDADPRRGTVVFRRRRGPR